MPTRPIPRALACTAALLIVTMVSEVSKAARDERLVRRKLENGRSLSSFAHSCSAKTRHDPSPDPAIYILHVLVELRIESGCKKSRNLMSSMQWHWKIASPHFHERDLWFIV